MYRPSDSCGRAQRRASEPDRLREQLTNRVQHGLLPLSGGHGVRFGHFAGQEPASV
jgi:hypothetical protein